MARFQRRPQEQKFTLASLAIGLFLTLLVLLFLFQLDNFPKRKKVSAHQPLLSPETVLVQNQLRAKANDPAPQQKTENVRKESANAESPIYYEMKVANLVGDTTTARLILQVHPDWAPVGAHHFDELVEAHFYDQARIFRCVPHFVIQFGIHADPAVHAQYKQRSLKDDPVVESNTRGTLTYAMAGKNTRTTQLFVNTGNNERLDDEGFAPFGRVVEGLEYLESFNCEYREQPKQPKIVNQGNVYLQEEFPRLSYVVSIERLEHYNGAAVQADDGTNLN